MSDPLTYENVVGELLRRIPSFAAVRNTDESYISNDDDSPHLVFADFSRFLLEHLYTQSEGEGNEQMLAQSFKLLDEMLTSSDGLVVNVAQVEVFEVLADHPNVLAIVKCYLSEEARIIMEKWLRRWLKWLHNGA